MTQKTFHPQTATFLGRLTTAFPSDLTSEEMQQCISDPNGLQRAVRSFLRPEPQRINVRCSVNLSRSVEEMIAAIGRLVDVDQQVLANMPRPRKGGMRDLVFIKAGRSLEVEEVTPWLKSQSLYPVYPDYALAWNADHPDFSATCPNLTQWQDKDGRYYAAYHFKTSIWSVVEVKLVRQATWGPDQWFVGTRD